MLGAVEGLITELRRIGLPIRVSESIDAAAALRHADLGQREEVKASLRACLVKDAQHLGAFETVFDLYFHLADSGKCGACKSVLAPRNEPIDVDPAAFDAIVHDAKVPVLVDFWAVWCGPCKMVSPEVQQVARNAAGKALVLKVNTELHPDLAARFSIQAIPNFLVFRDGKVVARHAGAAPASTMELWLGL